jgi:hypothetical protein
MKMRHESRRKRAFRQNLVKTAIWVFLFLFVASIVGVAVVALH